RVKYFSYKDAKNKINLVTVAEIMTLIGISLLVMISIIKLEYKQDYFNHQAVLYILIFLQDHASSK
ncbi:hypothetical protein BgiMline_031615, partial [Biomphalaria glabrata]